MEASSERARTRPGKPPRRGPVQERSAIAREIVLKAKAPEGSRFKGYDDVVVRDLVLEAVMIRYRRERWVTPSGASVVAALPPGLSGGFGPHLRRFLLAAHVQGQVTSERLVALVSGIGLAISKRQVVRLLTGPLDPFIAEDRAVLRAGLSSAAWISVDDTSAPCAARAHHHADRRCPHHRLPHRFFQIAAELPVAAAGRASLNATQAA